MTLPAFSSPLRFLPLPSLLVLGLLVAACDSGGGDDTLAVGTMEAQVDGSNWRATNATANKVTAAGTLSITITGARVGASTETMQVAITVQNGELPSPGTYTLSNDDDVSDGVAAQGSYAPSPTPTSTYFSTSGTLNLDAISEDGASGTFSFSAETPGSGETVDVQSGRFNVEFGVSVGV
jgi:hypothetical protein